MIAAPKSKLRKKLFAEMFHEPILLTLRRGRCQSGRNGQMHRLIVAGYGPKHLYIDRRDNVGKDQLPAGARSNLHRPDEIGTTEVIRRVLV